MLHESQIQEAYNDRRFFVQCESSTSGDGLLMAIANQLGFSRSQSHPLEKVTQFLVDQAARCLLVLDNFETAWDTEDKSNVETVLGALADIENVCLVVTMRGAEMPRGVAWTRPFLPPLRPLEHDAARQAFFALNECSEEDASVDELLEKLDRVPLAVALVGVRAQFSRPREILDAWGGGMKLERTAWMCRFEGGRVARGVHHSRGLGSACPRNERVISYVQLPLSSSANFTRGSPSTFVCQCRKRRTTHVDSLVDRTLQPPCSPIAESSLLLHTRRPSRER